ncbi:hypothetical protein HKX48_008161 [Thoreauomyces humboldtii]|nr:hypothetical protein HKX48_008161 [Thoreauomyces humboldtii]
MWATVFLLFLAGVNASTFNLTLLSSSLVSPNYTVLTPTGSSQYIRNYGGYAAFQTAMHSATTALGSKPVIALHGVTALGFSVFTQYWQGRKEHTYLENIGFQYLTFGSRDLFFGPDVYASNFLSNSSLHCVASNVLIAKSLPLSGYVKPYQVLMLTDHATSTTYKVVIIAYVVDNLCALTMCADPVGTTAYIKIEDVLVDMANFMDELMYVEAPDVVVALSSGLLWADDLVVAQSISGIDIIISSDSNQLAAGALPTMVRNPAGDPVLLYNDFVTSDIHGLVQLDVQFTNNVPVAWTGTLNPVISCQDDLTPLSTCVPPDATVLAAVTADSLLPNAALAGQIGKTQTFLNGAQKNSASVYVCRAVECTAGDVVVDAMMWQMGSQCDAAILNGGTIRASINAGVISGQQVKSMLPNANFISITSLKGADIFDALRNGFGHVSPEASAGPFPQVSNLQVVYNPNNTSPNRLVSVKILNTTTNAYVDMGPDTVYNLCVTDYMMGGGDGYTMLRAKAIAVFLQGAQLDIVTRNYLNASSIAIPLGLPAPVPGRLAYPAPTASGLSPPLVGSCVFSTMTSTANSGSLVDPCDGGYRHSTDLTWTITPTTAALSIYISFSNFTLDPSTDVLYIRDPTTLALVLVPPVTSQTGLVAANYTTLPTSVGIPNQASLTIRFTSNRPLTGSGLTMAFTSDAGCPGGYLLSSGTCTACPIGTSAAKGATSCTACPMGEIAFSTGSETCTACASGTYSAGTGGSKCLECDGGRVSTDPTKCACPSGNIYNGILCLPSETSQAGPIAGIAVGVLVVGGGVAFYVYRRRMALIKRRHLGIQKHKKLKADVAMKRLIQDVIHSLIQIGLDSAECFLDWHAFLAVGSDDKYKLVFIASCLFQSVITFLSAVIRTYNIVQMLKIRKEGVKLIAAGAKITSVEALARIKDAESDADLHMVLLNLRTLRQKVVVTIAVAIPGVFKSIPMLIVNALVARELGSGNSLTLLLAFGFNCLVFAVNIQETLGWFSLKHHYYKQKLLADSKLKELGLQRPEVGQMNRPVHSVPSATNMNEAAGKSRDGNVHVGGAEVPDIRIRSRAYSDDEVDPSSPLDPDTRV